MKSGCPACERNAPKKYYFSATDENGNVVQLLLTREQIDKIKIKIKNKIEIREVFE